MPSKRQLEEQLSDLEDVIEEARDILTGALEDLEDDEGEGEEQSEES